MKLWQFAPPRSVRKFKRELLYHWHRLNRIKGSTRQIALGFAIGASISMTPFIGIHLILGGALVLITRSSLLAMFIGSFLFGNPWTFPIIFWASKHIGNLFIDISSLHPNRTSLLHELLTLSSSLIKMLFGKISIWDFLTVVQEFFIFLFPFMIGSIPLAIFVFLFTFYMVEEAIVLYHSNRNKKRRKNLR